MAAENGYASQQSYELYDTTGGTEDWTYYATGGLGFTFEIGLIGFHPPYADTVAEYEGTSAGGRSRQGGNREAYFKALENTADAVQATRARRARRPPGAVLRLKKSFTDRHLAGDRRRRRRGRPDPLRRHAESRCMVPASRRLLAGASTRPRGRSWPRPGAARPPGRPSAARTCPATGPAPRACAAPPAGGQRRRATRTTPFTVPAGAGDRQREGHRRGRLGRPRPATTTSTSSETPTATAVAPDETQVGRHLGAGHHQQRVDHASASRRGHRRQAVRRRGSSTSPAREPYTGQVTYSGPSRRSGRRARRAGHLTCESPTGKVGERTHAQIDRGQRQDDRLLPRPAPGRDRASASPPRAAPRAPASAPHGSGASAPSSARRSRARCCPTARASTATA